MPPDAAPLPTVVYVCGVGHSGSTLLDLLLGAHPRAWSAGELKRLSPSRHAARWQAKGWPPVLEEPCTCGAPRIRACPFWQAVDVRLREQDLRLGTLDVYSPDAATFARHNEALFAALARESGAAVVVDSSKDITRLRRLLEETALPVRPVLLLRRGEGVVYSEVRRGRDWFRAAVAYGRVVLDARAYLRGRDHEVLTYEALCADPRGTLAALLEALGLPPHDLPPDPAQDDPAQGDPGQGPRHLLFGNPMRLRPLTEIRPDESWRRALPWGQRQAVAALTTPARRGWSALRPLYRRLAHRYPTTPDPR